MRRRRTEKDPSIFFAVVVRSLRVLMRVLTRRTWVDAERIPDRGGCIVVLNHISHADPLVTGHFLYDRGRIPRYLVKATLFKNPVLRRLLVLGGQIPVQRLTTHAVDAYSAAVAAIGEGNCLAIYPEGTLTRDPDLWPMRGKSGAARIALATGAPVFPVGHWGAHELLPPYSRRPHLLPRTHVTVKVGDPVDLEDLRGREVTPEVVQEATARIMAALVAIVEELREGTAPPVRFDPASAGMKQIGNPNARDQRTKRTKKDDD